MPINVIRVEAGIYVGEWHGVITVGEMRMSQAAMFEMADADHCQAVVFIHDLTKSGRVRVLDVRSMAGIVRVAERQVLRRIMVNPPHITQMTMNILQKVAGSRFIATQSRAAAIEIARKLLEHNGNDHPDSGEGTSAPITDEGHR